MIKYLWMIAFALGAVHNFGVASAQDDEQNNLELPAHIRGCWYIIQDPEESLQDRNDCYKILVEFYEEENPGSGTQGHEIDSTYGIYFDRTANKFYSLQELKSSQIPSYSIKQLPKNSVTMPKLENLDTITDQKIGPSIR